MAIPKGIRTRSTPDWLSQYMSCGGYGVEFGGTTFKYFGLFNDSSQGALLNIFGVQPTLGFAIFANIFFINGLVGSIIRPCIRINPQLGAPAGQITYLDNGASAITDAPLTTLGSYTAPPPPTEYPLFVVAPGYTMLVGSPQAEPTASCNWWYIPFTDQKGRSPA